MRLAGSVAGLGKTSNFLQNCGSKTTQKEYLGNIGKELMAVTKLINCGCEAVTLPSCVRDQCEK